jgi:hypothetical protein
MAQTAQAQRPVSPALVNGWVRSPKSYHTVGAFFPWTSLPPLKPVLHLPSP